MTGAKAGSENDESRGPWEPRRNDLKPTQQQKPRSFGEAIKAQFRAAAKAIIQTLAPSPAQRRKRREDTGKAFQRNQAILTKSKRFWLLRFMFDHRPFNAEQERAAEQERLWLSHKNIWGDESEGYSHDGHDAGEECRRGAWHPAGVDFDLEL